ncbi:MAG: FG-GAP repeat protein, partial [Phaeodactylibacter sp.]|nr:FG-GAP repeat protein [Phaeodactylibacter sp.]
PVYSPNDPLPDCENTNCQFETKILPDDGIDYMHFGVGNAIYGEFAFVGAWGDNSNGTNSGSAFIYKKEGAGWQLSQKILPTDGDSEDKFGTTLAAWGDFCIVGAVGDEENGLESGSAYIFKRNGDSWIQHTKLLPDDGAGFDRFGIEVDIYGSYAIVGARGNSDLGPSSGSAYIFHNDNGAWVQQAKLLPTDGDANDWFGSSVAIYGDYAVIGAHVDEENGLDSGSAYVFKRSGSTWTQVAKLLPNDGAPFDYFGFGLDIHQNTIAVGAFGNSDPGPSSGSAYVFQETAGNWVQVQKILPNDLEAGDEFGGDIKMNGQYLVASAAGSYINGSESGSVYLFEKEGDSWVQSQEIAPSDGSQGDRFRTASLYENHLLVASLEDDDIGIDGGSAYVFDLNCLNGISCSSAPQWNAQITGTPHTVIITPEAANCSAIGGLPLEPCDYIGFFYTDNNGERACSNFGEWTGEPLQIPVYGNDAFPPEKNGFANGESFTVKVWKQSTGEEYTVQATYQPIGSMADIGGASIPVTDQEAYTFLGTSAISCLETERCLTINLSPGVNFVSSYIIPDEANMGQIMQPVADDINLIKSDNPLLQWRPGFNDPFDWEVAEGYQILAYNAASFDICGRPADPATTPIEVETSRGWHFISYLRSSPANVHQQLEPHLSLIGQVRNSLGITYAGQSPGPFDMQPGQGYYLYPVADGSFHYNGSGRPNPGPPTSNPDQARSNTHFHQPVYNPGIDASLLMPAAVLEGVIAEGDEVAVTRADGQVVAAAVYEGKNFILSLWGNAPETNEVEGLAPGEPFYLKVWKKAAEQEYETQFTLVEQPPTFWKDAIYWLETLTLLQPVSTPQTAIEPPLLNLFPNPVKSELFIEFRRPVLQAGQLQVLSSNGALMEIAVVFPGSTSSMVFSTQHLAPGAYLFRFILNGKAET